MSLTEIGWNLFFCEQFEPYQAQGYVPARVVCGQKHIYDVLSDIGELTAQVSGKFRHQASFDSDFPVVGDWVVIQPHLREAKATIHAILPRKTKVSRKVSGGASRLSGGITEEQVIASNIDTIFIVIGLDRDFNLRRIERYLTFVYNSGANPVIVLNKEDLCVDLETSLAEVESIAYGVPVHALSAKENQGLEPLLRYLEVGKTAALVGSSGVGKSTIINSLLGSERLRVDFISASTNKGLHTTTHRELIVLPTGGIIMDNPGMRELQLWGDEENLKGTFTDIEDLATQCRFHDCRHESEPGCAVREALEQGILDHKRFRSYLKLKKELLYLEKRRHQSAQVIEKEHWKQIAKSQRVFSKYKHG
jgi:ribosome biogenesis GTPase